MFDEANVHSTLPPLLRDTVFVPHWVHQVPLTVVEVPISDTNVPDPLENTNLTLVIVCPEGIPNSE